MVDGLWNIIVETVDSDSCLVSASVSMQDAPESALYDKTEETEKESDRASKGRASKGRGVMIPEIETHAQHAAHAHAHALSLARTQERRMDRVIDTPPRHPLLDTPTDPNTHTHIPSPSRRDV